MKQVAPSFLSADIWRAAQQVQDLEQAGCKYLHLDIMDGHFVPNISFGPAWVKGLRPHCGLVFDAHLMVEEPDFLLESFAKAGVDYLTVHVEAVKHLDRTVARIRELGMKPGVALNPATSLSTLEEVLPLVDLALVMSVNPGFGGQKLIPYALHKVERLADIRRSLGLSFLIEIDGGVTADNAASASAAGADLLVAGSAVFGKENVAAAFTAVQQAANS